MMSLYEKFLIAVAVIAASFVAVGCASDRLHIAESKASLEQHQQELTDQATAAQIAINNMEDYMQQLEQQPEIDIQVLNIESNETMASTKGEDTLEVSIADEDLQSIEIHDEEIKLTEKTETNAGIVVSPPPKPLQFQFDYDKYEVSESDRLALEQHSDYLLQNPNYILVINGHTDNRGAAVYNQQLSEKRAQSVADLLIAAGVPASQLRVSGFGDNIPKISPEHWAENRRVELTYQDSMVAQHQ